MFNPVGFGSYATPGGGGEMLKIVYDPGNDGLVDKSETITDIYEAGENIGGDTLVMVSGGQVFKFDPSVEANSGLHIGFTKTSVLIGDPVEVIISGIANNPGWGLTPDGIYYAVAAGLISTAVPSSGIVLRVGVAIDADNLQILFSNPVILA